MWFSLRLYSAPRCQAFLNVPKCTLPWGAPCPKPWELIQPMMQDSLKSNVCKLDLSWPAPRVWQISLWHTCWWNWCACAWCMRLLGIVWYYAFFSQLGSIYFSIWCRILSRDRWSLLQSEHPQLSAVIEVMSYYHLSLVASGVILEFAPLTLLKRSSAASNRCNLHLPGPTANFIIWGLRHVGKACFPFHLPLLRHLIFTTERNLMILVTQA